jgi:hypothetical protein
LATWQDDSGGSFIASTVLPGASDVVYFNNFTVQMDVDATVLQIRNNTATGVTAGGTGVISTSRTVNADLFHASGNNLISITASFPSVVNINGNLVSTSTSNFNAGVRLTSSATLNFVGNVTTTVWRGIELASAATLNLTGDVYGGTQAGAGGATGVGNGIEGLNSNTINIVGNVFGGSGISNYGIGLQGNSHTVNIIGNVTAGISNNIGNPCTAIRSSGTASVTITGSLSANTNSYGVAGGLTLYMFGDIYNAANGLIATFINFVFIENVNSWEFRKSNLTTNTLYTPGVAIGFPATTNVKTGIAYGPTSNLTGTCAVPPANTVSLGVPVDNTVGTASLDANALAIALNASLSVSLPPALTTSLDASLSASLPAAIAPLLWDEAVTNITTPNSIGERLKNCSTVATTGAQIASFNP